MPLPCHASRLSLAAAAASALFVAGCGGSSSSSHATASGTPVGGAAITRAADVSGAAKGERVAYTLTEQVPSLGRLSVTGTGAFNNTPANNGQINLRLAVPDASSLGAAAGSILSNLQLALVVNRGTVYLKLPTSLAALASSFTHGKPWVSVNLAKLGSASSIPGLSSVLNGGTGPTNPAATLKQLASASSDGVTKVGSATVNGVATTEYRGTLDLTKLSAQLPANVRSATQAQLARAAKQFGVSRLPFRIYIDSANLVRRVQFALNGAQVAGQNLAASMQLDFLAYGSQPAPTVPSPADTYDASGAVGSLGSQLSGGGGGFGG